MKNRLLILLSILLVITLGITYAWWRWNSSTNTDVTFTIDGVTVTYEAGNDITGIKLIPVSTKEKGVTDNTAISKEITVSASKNLYFDLNMNLEVFPQGLQHKSLKWEIYTGNTLVNSGNFGSSTEGDTIQLLHNREVGTTSTTYKLYIWIDGNQDNPTAMMNQNYKFVLGATATDEAPRSDLPDFILNSNAPLDSVNSTYVTGYYESYELSNEDKATLKAYMANNGMSDSEQADQCIANEGSMSGCLDYYLGQYNEANDPDIQLIGVGNLTPGINFKENASDTNGKGLYIRTGTENNINPIYYYRGAVENNNVYFANYCWKIVRTTDTGGLKLIYNGTPTSGTCGSGVESQENSTIGESVFNTNDNDAKYVGYTYDNNGTETDSTIKGVIDTWYQTNILTNFDSYIEDTVYCNDREEANASELTELQQSNANITKAYKPTVRLQITRIPSLECANNADKYTKSSSIGNGKLQYSVGLLTADEIWLAGTCFGSINNYLNNNSAWWSISPSYFDNQYDGLVGVYFARHDEGLFTTSVGGMHVNVRPAISLKPEYNTFEYGNGTVSNPYRFVATVPSS